MENKPVYFTLDLLKIIMAVLIIMRHCGQVFFDSNSLFVKIITNTISTLGVPVFFVISGFFGEMSTDLKKYLYRILKLYAVWTVIYSPLIIKNYVENGDSLVESFVGFVKKMIFDGSYYHLWYLPALFCAIVFLSIVSKVLNNKQLIIIGIVLFVNGTLVDTYGIDVLHIVESYKDLFITTRNGLFFGTMFVIIGKIICDNRNKLIHVSIKKCLLVLFFSILMLFCEGYVLNRVIEKEIVNMTLISAIVAPMIVIVSLLFNKDKIKINGKLCRNVSTVMFCIHPIIISIVIIFNRYVSCNSGLNTILVVFITALVSYVIVKLSNFIKIIRVLV